MAFAAVRVCALFLVAIGVWVAVPARAAGLLEGIDLPRGYQPLDMPRDFAGASLVGALVQISPRRGFRYLGHLRDCGLPEQVLRPLSGLAGLATLSRRTLKVNAGIGATFLQAFGLELKGDSTSQIEITLGAAIDEMLVPIAVVGAARAHDAALKQNCGDVLRAANVFWINNAIRVDSLTVRLLDARGASVAATAEQLGAAIGNLNAQASVAATADGLLEIRRPVYIAFRDAPPAELLTGRIQLHSNQPQGKEPVVVFGDEVFSSQ